MEKLSAVIELVDKMSAPLKEISGLFGEFVAGLKEGMKAELDFIRHSNDASAATKELSENLGKLKPPPGADLTRAELAKIAAQAYIAGQAIREFMQYAGRRIELAQEVEDLSKRFNVGTESIRGYALMAGNAGIKLDQFMDTLKELNSHMMDAQDEDSKQAQAFDALGVSVDDAKGRMKDLDTILPEIADGFSKLQDSPEKTAIAVALFGEEAYRMIPILNQGSAGIKAMKEEAAQLNGMSPEMMKAFGTEAVNLRENTSKLKIIFGGLADELIGNVLPILNMLAAEFIESYKSGGMVAQIAEGIKVVFIGALIPAVKLGIIYLRSFADVVNLAGKAAGAIGAIVAAVARGDLEGARAVWQGFKGDVADTAAANAKFQEKMMDVSLASTAASTALNTTHGHVGKLAPKLKDASGAAKQLSSSLEEMLTSLIATNKTFGLDDSFKQLIEAQARYNKDVKAGLNKEREARLLDETKAQIELNRALREGKEANDNYLRAKEGAASLEEQVALQELEARMIGKSKEERDAAVQAMKDENEVRKATKGLTEEAAGAIAEEIRALQARRNAAQGAIDDNERLNKLVGQSWVQKSKDALNDVAFLYQAFQDGRIATEDEYVSAVEARLKKLKGDHKENADAVTEFWKEAAKNIQNNFADFFYDVMQGKMSDLGDTFKKTVDKMVSQAAAAKLMETLLGNNFAKTGSLGGWAGEALTYLSSLYAGGRATGGAVQAGMTYTVGEKRAETFVAPSDGYIVPNAGTQPMSVQMNINAVDAKSFLQLAGSNGKDLARLISTAQKSYNL